MSDQDPKEVPDHVKDKKFEAAWRRANRQGITIGNMSQLEVEFSQFAQDLRVACQPELAALAQAIHDQMASLRANCFRTLEHERRTWEE